LSFADCQVQLEELVWSLDEPLADLSALGFHALSELAARHVTVALSGQGADELFAGYRKYRAIAVAARCRTIPGAAAAARMLLRVAPARLERPLRTIAADDPVDRLLATSGHLD